MTLTLDLTPTEEAQITAVAQSAGLTPAEAARKLLTQNLPPTETEGRLRNASSIALLRSWLAEDATDDPDEVRQKQMSLPSPAELLRGWLRDEATDDPALIQQAQEELDEFKRNMNANRAATGERLLYPEQR